MIQEYNDKEFIVKFSSKNGYMSALDNRKTVRKLCSFHFYLKMLFGPFQWLCRKARKGQCTDTVWVYASAWTSELVEDAGCPISIEGMENFLSFDGPCVFVANHMSTLETLMLPCIIRPHKPVTYVVKESLMSLPFFGAVMHSRNPIVVGRKNPREDLKTVLEGGKERLANGISVIIFPQSTRSTVFDPAHFNSIGIKLARNAGVPVVPLALKTDAWGQGKYVKDLGKITPGLPIRFKFFPSLQINGQGKEEHLQITSCIGECLDAWQSQDGCA